MIRGQQIQIDSTLAEKKSLLQEIEPYRRELTSKISEVLCYNLRDLEREEAPLESGLGNLYADICLERANRIFQAETGKAIDFALFNYNGIRTSLPEGPLTVGNVFRLMPFENKLVVVELRGAQVQELFHYLEKSMKANPVSGIRLKMSNGRLIEISIGGLPFDPDRHYYVLTHDYLQHGGDNMSFFKDPVSLFPTELKVRDALIEAFRSVDTLKADLDDRFISID